MSFLISATPPFVVCLVFPTGAPESTKLAIFFFIHTSHSPMLFFRSGVAADVVFDIGNTTFRCLFGLPDRRTRVYETRHILLHPHLPLPHALLPIWSSRRCRF